MEYVAALAAINKAKCVYVWVNFSPEAGDYLLISKAQAHTGLHDIDGNVSQAGTRVNVSTNGNSVYIGG